MDRWQKRFYPRINIRITIPFLFVSTLIGVVGIFIVTRLVSGSIQERINRQLLDSAEAATNTIIEIERQQIATLRALAYTNDVPEALATADLEALNKLLSPIAINNDLDELLVYDINGVNIFRLSRPAEGHRGQAIPLLETQGWQGVQRVITGLADNLGDKYVDIQSVNRQTTFFFSAPIFTDNNILVGGISVGIYANNFTRRISEQALSEIILFDNAGAILGSTFRNVAPEALQVLSPQSEPISDTLLQSYTPIEEKLIGQIPYQILYGHFRLREQNIGLMVVALSTEFVIDRIGTSRDAFVVLFSALLVAVMALGLWITRSIVHPVQRLVATTRAIQSGDLNQRVGLYTPDELGELGQSFDHMTNELVKRNAEINQLYIQQVGETARRDAILTSISDAVIVLDLLGNSIHRNEAANRLINAVQNNGHEWGLFSKLCGQPQQLLNPISAKFAERHFSVLATPVQSNEGDLLGYVIVFRDITEIILAEKLKDELILQLSHELRTPLTAIQGYVDLAKLFQQSGQTEQSYSYVDKAAEQLRILSHMMNQVVDVSAIIANQFYVDIEPFELQPLLADVIEQHRPAVLKAGLRIYTQFPSAIITIEGDRARLRQAFEQVFINAYYYTLPGGWVDVTIEQLETGAVTIIISDTGVGIGPDEVDKVFERMYRGQSADAGPTDQRGLGLGLYLARHIVTAHGGTLSLESDPKIGTAVTFRLPIKQASAVVAT